MALVRSTGTKPELKVRQALRAMGIKFKTHDARVPGTPDFTVSSRRLAIFVHGCFWHRHASCHNGRRLPKSRVRFWENKLDNNRKRDARIFRKLNRLGWSYMVLWECQIRDTEALTKKIHRVLSRGNH